MEQNKRGERMGTAGMTDWEHGESEGEPKDAGGTG